MATKLEVGVDIFSALGTAVAAGAAIAAVCVAGQGLTSAANQLKGITLYNIAKDGKALQKRYLEKTADADEVMSFFYSVYRLHTSNILDQTSWQPIETALCRFSHDITIADIPRWWATHKDMYDSEFRALVKTLQGVPECKP
jgi:hypothetical protein